MIVCLEGGDGSGKTTHAKLLAERIQTEWLSPPAVFHFTNYETPTGQLIKRMLNKELPWDPLLFQCVQLANKVEATEAIEEAQENGQHVVLARYWMSALVYGTNDGLSEDWLNTIHTNLPFPDLSILLDVDPKNSFDRRPEGRDRYEENREYMENIFASYRRLWINMQGWERDRRDPKFVIVNARESKQATHEAIWREVTSALVEIEG